MQFTFSGLFAVLMVLSAAPACAASFEDYPTRAAGLWVITTTLDAQEHENDRAEVMQVCLDADTDRVAFRHTAQLCTLPQLVHDGERVDYTMVCEQDGTTVTTKGTYLGNFHSEYTVTLDVTSEPPIPGVSNSTVVQKARRLGDCKPGQKPGDVIRPAFETAE